MVTCVILNYNDSSTTINLLKNILEYRSIDKIIVVDGASTDDSVDRLKEYECDKIVVLQADKNGGYGYGNNLGISYSRKIGAQYVIIANPDVAFTERSIVNTISLFELHDDCIAAAPVMEGREPAYKFASSPLIDALQASIIFNKLIRPRYYARGYFKNKTECQVDILPGSLLIIDVSKLLNDKLYDEKIFLYHEEAVIGRQFKEWGLTSWVNLQDEYQHYHSISIKKNFSSVIAVKKIVITSHQYYLKNYLNSRASARFLGICRPLLYFEAYCWNCLKKIR